MTPAQAIKAIEKVLASGQTKSDKARDLFKLGLTKTEVSELVPMNYSQAHSVWAKEGYVSQPVPRVRKDSQRDSGLANGKAHSPRALYLTPTQTRYAAQDGHEVVRVDRATGAECYNCGAPVQFSLKWLSFVHSASKNDPTELEDRYPE